MSEIRQNPAERPQHESRSEIRVGSISAISRHALSDADSKKRKAIETWSSVSNVKLHLHAGLLAPLWGYIT
jgi:hypothetical protein